MTAASEFRLYHGNALEVLAGLLAEEIRQPLPGMSPLQPEVILIPQVAMRRWLQATLAQRHGVAANLEFLTPGEFVARALDANLGQANDDLDSAGLQWRLYAALGDPRVLAQPALAKYASYLSGDDALKAWTLAGELAAVFEKYQAWRRDWLLRWDAGADPDDPQAILWRAIAAGRQHRARRIQDYLARYADGDALPTGLPPRLFAFGTLNVSPDVLRVLATQARVGVLHFYLPTPTQKFWGDLQGVAARLRAGEDPFEAADENPLLRDWGAAGKDFVALLGSYEVVHPSGEVAAYADPVAAEAGAEQTAAARWRRHSLLRRMQSDLLHRRATPSGGLRHRLDADDPSLQLHACHTRLRELQVLHDRLRALLDDPRFEPPLQAREIAVLAPDIDPYLPYLDAVFGAPGSDGAIPYAKADTRPLADEPLAEVFLRLLGLPLSRFGLEEVLDLLASPPLADAAGLDVEAIERLHAWLRAAGARWGLDAAHRARCGAPAESAYTWQFALDRLLLGHASGDDVMIGGPSIGSGPAIAPWPALEGGALDALDRLLRLLHELARHERALGEALSPAQWRARLSGLLDALLPTPPADHAGQRALQRLRVLIDDFAHQAAQAGFESPLPADVVRAHFAARLGESDTRAPLLTGGVSFARMVPMRLLPFRVICLLGMNDGDFPRRDPASALNRLSAELGSERRRRGDRSTRDDDRFLFLQLFAAAQDVFYLSWLGADPRDGRAREPSGVIAELLRELRTGCADHGETAQLPVLTHALHPFSPAAFGVDDARHFSYRRSWHGAADRVASARTPLTPWMPDAARLEAEANESELTLEALRRFLLDPVGSFLRQRLALRLPQRDEADADIEPLQAPRRGLPQHALQRAVFAALNSQREEADIAVELRARGLLPAGGMGLRVLRQLVGQTRAYADAVARWRGDAVPDTLALEVMVDGVRLHGRLADAMPHGLLRVQFGARRGRSAIRHGLDWLLASAAGLQTPLVEFHDDPTRGIGPHPREPLSRAAALDALRQLLAWRRDGLQRPLLFAPYSSWACFEADSIERGLQDAAKKWHGGFQQWAERDEDALRLALRARNPFTDLADAREFVATAGAIFGLVTAGAVRAAPNIEGLLPECDVEDAE